MATKGVQTKFKGMQNAFFMKFPMKMKELGWF